MSSLKYWYKVTRPQQCLIAALSTWLIALLSNGPSWFSTEKVAAPITMFCGVLGASLWHYSARSDVYARKYRNQVIVSNPSLIFILSTIAFTTSAFSAIIFLPWECMVIAFINLLIIILYAKRLDQSWPWKNIVIAFICTTPLLIGWFAGNRLHPIVPPLILTTFFLYFAREIMKDVHDEEADRGLRFTLVMHLGVKPTLKIAGVFLTIALLTILTVWKYIPHNSEIATISYGVGFILLLWNAIQLLRGVNIASKYWRIDFSVLAFLICILATKLYFS